MKIIYTALAIFALALSLSPLALAQRGHGRREAPRHEAPRHEAPQHNREHGRHEYRAHNAGRKHYHNGRYDQDYYEEHYGYHHWFYFGGLEWYGPAYASQSVFIYDGDGWLLLEPVPNAWLYGPTYIAVDADGNYYLVSPWYPGVYVAIAVMN